MHNVDSVVYRGQFTVHYLQLQIHSTLYGISSTFLCARGEGGGWLRELNYIELYTYQLIKVYKYNPHETVLSQKNSLSVGWSVQKLQRTLQQFFLIFCIKLTIDKVRKLTKPDFRKKICFSRNPAKSVKKCHFWHFFQFCGKSNHGLGIQMIFK